MPAFGWWYPEEPLSTQYDWRRSNINILIDDGPEGLATGTVQPRGIPCRIYKEPSPAGGGSGCSSRVA